jgi:hypothetical protein
MSPGLKSLILIVTVCILTGASAAAARTRVHVALLNGLNASAITEPLMPTLWDSATPP